MGWIKHQKTACGSRRRGEHGSDSGAGAVAGNPGPELHLPRLFLCYLHSKPCPRAGDAGTVTTHKHGGRALAPNHSSPLDKTGIKNNPELTQSSPSKTPPAYLMASEAPAESRNAEYKWAAVQRFQVLGDLTYKAVFYFSELFTKCMCHFIFTSLYCSGL